MKTFELNIFDEQLNNGDELKQFLDDNPETVCVSARMEGPSLEYCGVLAILDEHCERTRRDPKTICIDTTNLVEEYVYPKLSERHHWWHSSLQAYKRADVTPIDLRHRRFACLIGRKNPERLAMLYWLRTKDCLLSSMRDDNYHPGLMQMDRTKGWVDDHQDLCQWIHDIEIPALDDYKVIDQYVAKDPDQDQWGKTHMALLNFYHNFDIELAVETWTRGTTFFPTEKTVRPLAAAKPFIMYGARHWMKHLRDQGFMTWGDCWDQSYDDYEGTERWKRIQDLVSQINMLETDEFQDIMTEANEIAKYNQELAIKTDWRN